MRIWWPGMSPTSIVCCCVNFVCSPDVLHEMVRLSWARPSDVTNTVRPAATLSATNTLTPLLMKVVIPSSPPALRASFVLDNACRDIYHPCRLPPSRRIEGFRHLHLHGLPTRSTPPGAKRCRNSQGTSPKCAKLVPAAGGGTRTGDENTELRGLRCRTTQCGGAWSPEGPPQPIYLACAI